MKSELGHFQLQSECSLAFSSSHHSCYVIPRRLCYVIQRLYSPFKLCLLGYRKRFQITVRLALLEFEFPQFSKTSIYHKVLCDSRCNSDLQYIWPQKKISLHPSVLSILFTNAIAWFVCNITIFAIFPRNVFVRPCYLQSIQHSLTAFRVIVTKLIYWFVFTNTISPFFSCHTERF